MVSLEYLDSIFNTSEFNFKNVPKDIIIRIDNLLLTVDKADVLLGLTQLKPLFDERVNQGRRFGGSSGSAMQELMVDEMKQFYLSMVKDYVGALAQPYELGFALPDGIFDGRQYCLSHWDKTYLINCDLPCISSAHLGGNSECSVAIEGEELQEDIKRIKDFVGKVGPHLFHEDVDINAIRSAYLSVRDIFDKINYYAVGEFEYQSNEHSLQYDLRTALHYSVEQLLKSDLASIRLLLDIIFERVRALLLIGYPLSLVVGSHNGYFLPRLEVELECCFNKKIENRERMGLSCYLTYQSAEELLTLCPEMAKRVLPLVFQNDWCSGFCMAYANALYSFGDRSDSVIKYYCLFNKDFSSSFFQNTECFDVVKKTIEYYVKARSIEPLPEDVSPLEELLKTIGEKFNDPKIIHYLNNKWHGDHWYKRTIELRNGWRFMLQRAPFIESARLCICGGERARDDYVASYPEQEKWLHKVLKNNSLGTYSVSWVIDFYIYGNNLLKYVIEEILSVDEVVKDEIILPS